MSYDARYHAGPVANASVSRFDAVGYIVGAPQKRDVRVEAEGLYVDDTLEITRGDLASGRARPEGGRFFVDVQRRDGRDVGVAIRPSAPGPRDAAFVDEPFSLDALESKSAGATRRA